MATEEKIVYKIVNKKNYKKYHQEILEFYNRYFPESSNIPVIKNSSLFFIALKEGKIIGCCRLLTDFSRNATLYDLIVRKEERNKGVGTKITKMAIDFCQKKSIKKLYLTTDPRSPWLKDFYAKLGFSVVSDQILMRIEF